MMVTKMSTVEGLAKVRDGGMVGGGGKGAGRMQGRDGGERGLLPLHNWQLGDNNDDTAAAFGEMLARGGTTTEDGPSPPLSIAFHMALALGGPSRLPPGGAANATGDTSGKARHGNHAQTLRRQWDAASQGGGSQQGAAMARGIIE